MSTNPIQEMPETVETRHVEVDGLYFKPGDDLGHWVRNAETPVEALQRHAKQLRKAAERLEKIASAIKDAPAGSVEIDADTHHIGITMPSEAAAPLLRSRIVSRPRW